MSQDVCGATEGFTIYCPRMFMEFATEGFPCLIEFISVSIRYMRWSCILLYFVINGCASVTALDKPTIGLMGLTRRHISLCFI
ncbi:hypothetical protein Syun_022842 [Stephania yunnanensis]|uniref:Uncharacterized protein n=1 Tax=Stephania yunnanensis TaxID=152371 RepID=A0AAP0I314_9MAGN